MPRVVTRKVKSRRRTAKGGPLTEKQRRFVEEYVIDFNGARAAREAGYSSPGDTAVALKKNANIACAIEAAIELQTEKCELTAQMILEQLVYGVTRDGKDFVDKNGRIITNLQKLPKRVTAMIDSIEQEVSYDDKGDERVKTKLRLVSKATCIDLAMKHKGLLAPEKHEHQHQHLTIDLNQLFESQEREKDDTTLRLEQEALLCVPEPDSTNLPRESGDSSSRPRPTGTNGSSRR